MSTERKRGANEFGLFPFRSPLLGECSLAPRYTRRSLKFKMQNANLKMTNQNSKFILFEFYIFILHFEI